jgi:hypothetical protein
MVKRVYIYVHVVTAIIVTVESAATRHKLVTRVGMTGQVYRLVRLF